MDELRGDTKTWDIYVVTDTVGKCVGKNGRITPIARW